MGLKERSISRGRGAGPGRGVGSEPRPGRRARTAGSGFLPPRQTAHVQASAGEGLWTLRHSTRCEREETTWTLLHQGQNWHDRGSHGLQMAFCPRAGPRCPETPSRIPEIAMVSILPPMHCSREPHPRVRVLSNSAFRQRLAYLQEPCVRARPSLRLLQTPAGKRAELMSRYIEAEESKRCACSAVGGGGILRTLRMVVSATLCSLSLRLGFVDCLRANYFLYALPPLLAPVVGTL